MILAALIFIPILGGILALWASRWSSLSARWIALFALVLDFVFLPGLWIGNRHHEFSRNWIPQWGIRFHLNMDGLSLLFVTLTLLLGTVSVLASWKEIKQKAGFFYFNLMWILSGILGVFLAADLFLFYFFWELMLVPMYFLIGIWGYERRSYAAFKFFIFTQVSGLFMLVSILGLGFLHARTTGVYSFDYTDLLGIKLDPSVEVWLMLGFFVAFAVKLPMVPLHTWLPDAHTEAPTAGSVILAGLLLKTGGYGLIRFVLPLFPHASREFAPFASLLAVIGIGYGAVLAFAQTDLKRLVAYTSVSHMGFVLLGAFALGLGGSSPESWKEIALQGVVVQMISHGLSTGALFVWVGAIQERLHTRDINQLGGLWTVVPKMSGVGLLLALASLGLPGLGNFVGEFLILLGAFRVSPGMASLATFGFILATIYSLWMVQKVEFGEKRHPSLLADLSWREGMVFGALVISNIWLGLYPQPVLDTLFISSAKWR